MGALREVEPEEGAALGVAPRRARAAEVEVERVEHCVAARLEQGLDALEVRLEVSIADEAMERRLRQERGRDRRRACDRLEPLHERLREDEVAGPQTRSDGLRE